MGKRREKSALGPGSKLGKKSKKQGQIGKILASETIRAVSVYIFFPSAEPGPRLLLKNSTLAEIFGMLDWSHGLTSLEKVQIFRL